MVRNRLYLSDGETDRAEVGCDKVKTELLLLTSVIKGTRWI